MKFRTWLEVQQHQIIINNKKLIDQFNSQVEKMIDYTYDKHNQSLNFNTESFFKNIETTFVSYPNIKNLIKSLNSKNFKYIFDQQSKLRKWLESQPYNRNQRELSRQIHTYVDTFNPIDIDKESTYWKDMAVQALKKTQIEMEKLKSLIESAINRISHWNNTPVTIVPSPNIDQYQGVELSLTNSAEIILGNDNMSPSFMLFPTEGGIEIDDVLEGGDTDFFISPQIQADYFNLINEIRKPGSTNRSKTLTLYTARPKKDRQQFLNTKTLPVNIFLANNYDHVVGLARDLGSNEIRDTWRVRINAQYLTQTLDGKIKEYQVTVDNAPVISLDLVG